MDYSMERLFEVALRQGMLVGEIRPKCIMVRFWITKLDYIINVMSNKPQGKERGY